MGIRGLTSRLNKHAIEQKIGCEGCSSSSSPTTLIIDGPSFAYWVYSRILAIYIGKSDSEARPTFELVAIAIQYLLQQFEINNVKISRIYFDGGLPVWKRSTRYTRLHQDHAFRKKLKIRYGTGVRLVNRIESQHIIRNLMSSSTEVHKLQVNGVSPFLVQHVIEALRNLGLGERIEIVPDEADGWCAAYAKENSGLILTDDSDLAVHDIGHGQVAFLGSLGRRTCPSCNKHGIFVRVINPTCITQEFSSPDVKHAAYKLEIQSNAPANQPHWKSFQSPNSGSAVKETFDEFCSKYPIINLQQDTEIRRKLQCLDPRLSEIIVQFERNTDNEILSILPSLLDDPERRSAWRTTDSIRAFIYTLMVKYLGNGTSHTVLESIETGQPDNKPKVVVIQEEEEYAQTAESLVLMLQSIDEALAGSNSKATFWRTVCSIHVVYHQVCSGSAETGTFAALLDRMSSREQQLDLIYSWRELHFQAQIEATYYSFRQLHQLLYFFEFTHKIDESDVLWILNKHLEGFPSVMDMFTQGAKPGGKLNPQLIIASATEMLNDHDELGL